MPLARTAEQTTPTPAPQHSAPPSGSVVSGFESVPFEVYRFFNANPSQIQTDDIKQIKTVYKWSLEGSNGLGDAVNKIRNLEVKLGQPAVGESRYTKLYNYIRVSDLVRDLENERDRQVNRILKIRQEQADTIKREQAKKLSEIEKQAKAETNALKKSRESELRQFRKLRQAYGG